MKPMSFRRPTHSFPGSNKPRYGNVNMNWESPFPVWTRIASNSLHDSIIGPPILSPTATPKRVRGENTKWIIYCFINYHPPPQYCPFHPIRKKFRITNTSVSMNYEIPCLPIRPCCGLPGSEGLWIEVDWNGGIIWRMPWRANIPMNRLPTLIHPWIMSHRTTYPLIPNRLEFCQRHHH